MLESSHAPARLEAVSTFSRLALPGALSGTSGVTVMERRGLGIASVTHRKNRETQLRELLAEGFGLSLRDGPKVSASDDGLTFVGTGPGKWLAIRQGGGWRFARDLAARLSDAATVCDESSRYGILRLTGPKLRATLAKGVPIDLHPSTFAPGDAASTLLGHVGIVLWQVDAAPSFDIAVSRSFAADAWHVLSTGAAEFGLAVASPID